MAKESTSCLSQAQMRNGNCAVVTGMGALTPLGNSVEAFWQGCLEGRSGIDWATLCDPGAYGVKVDGEVRDFDARAFIDGKEARHMGRFSQFAVAAAAMAIEDAALCLEKEDLTRIGVIIGSANGGVPETDAAMRTILGRGGSHLDPFFLPKSLPNMAAAQVARRFGLEGYNATIATACTAGTHAIGIALDVIRLGRADVVIAGASEAGISELGLAAFAAMRALSTRDDDPARVSRPFDADRSGFVCAEGAGILVIESFEHARRRGACIRAEVAGFGATSDACHIVAPGTEARGASQTIRLALLDAGVGPANVDYISAHGTSTVANDVAETTAIKAAFGDLAYQIPISATKSMIGHALGAAGAIETIACVKAIETATLPPTINYESPDPDCDLDYVPNQARRGQRVSTVLKNSFGFGGQNACLVIRGMNDGVHEGGYPTAPWSCDL